MKSDAPEAPPAPAPPPKEAAGRPAPIDSLTSLRGLAALWVVVHHFSGDLLPLLPSLAPLEPLFAAGWLAVPFFFTLSGFVLAYNYAPGFRRVTRRGYLGFLGRRWLRIYPVHFATLLATLALVVVAGRLGVAVNRPDKFSARDFVLNLFLVQTWVPHFRLNWNGPSWSISSEWFAYLCCPFLCSALWRLSAAGRAGVAVLGALASVGFFAWAIGMPFSELVSVMPTFLTGCALGTYLLGRRDPPRLPRRLPDLLVLATAGAALLWPVSAGDDPVRHRLVVAALVLCFAGATYAFACLGPACSPPWRGRALIYLGEVSYSLYMTHGLVLMVTPKLLNSARFAGATLAVRLLVVFAYAAAVAAATLASYYLIEKPARRAAAIFPRWGEGGDRPPHGRAAARPGDSHGDAGAAGARSGGGPPVDIPRPDR